MMERMKIVIEPSSATVVAAVLKDERFKGKKVCCILSGGNIDFSVLFSHLKSQIKQWSKLLFKSISYQNTLKQQTSILSLQNFDFDLIINQSL